MAGLRTVGAIALALAVLGLLGADVGHMVTGAMAAMVATFALKEKQRREQALTLALGLPVAVAAMSLGALLSGHVVAGDVVFIALIFVAVYCRRYGDRGTALGLIGFQVYFVSLFVGATPSTLPGLCAILAIGFACSAVVRFVIVVETPERVLTRLREAFRARFAQLVCAQTELLDADSDHVEKALDDVRLHTRRLHESAMMIQGRLEEGTSDSTTASLLQRRVADAEISAERLGLLILTARSAERAATLTLHLPNAPLPAPGDRLRAQDDTTAILRRDLDALRLLVVRPLSGEHGTGLAQVRNRLLGYRDEENLPRGSSAVQDVFRGIGEAARAVLGLRLAIDGPQDESDDTPRRLVPARKWTPRTWPSPPRRRSSKSRTPGAGPAHDPGGGAGLGGLGPGHRGRRTALPAAVVLGGADLLGGLPEHLLHGEIMVKGYRRLLGTVLGVIAGVALAGVVGNHTWTAFALVLLLIFAMYFTAPCRTSSRPSS